jgi:hypothetical protein
MVLNPAFRYTPNDGDILPQYVCGVNGPRVNVYDHGSNYAITLLIGDFHKHARTEKGTVKCVPCADRVHMIA